jgi:hypothetical protein
MKVSTLALMLASKVSHPTPWCTQRNRGSRGKQFGMVTGGCAQGEGVIVADGLCQD